MKNKTITTNTIKHSQSSFTLIELLVVIAIIGIISGIIIINLNGITDKANFAKSQVFSTSLRDALLMNLVSEWNFDDLTTAKEGAVIKDFWGTNNGTLYTGSDGLEKLSADCVTGKCLSFDGVNDYVDCGDTGVNSSITVEAWIKTIQNSGNWSAVIKAKTAAPWEGFVLRNLTNNDPKRVRFSIWGNSSGNDATHIAIINDGHWHHIVGTYNSSIIKIYVDSIKGTDASYSTNPSNNQHLLIGTSVAGWTGGFFSGFIDGVRVYNTAIPTAMVKEHYVAGLQSLLNNKAITYQEYTDRLAELNTYCAFNQ